jgi:hypothetical protein
MTAPVIGCEIGGNAANGCRWAALGTAGTAIKAVIHAVGLGVKVQGPQRRSAARSHRNTLLIPADKVPGTVVGSVFELVPLGATGLRSGPRCRSGCPAKQAVTPAGIVLPAVPLTSCKKERRCWLKHPVPIKSTDALVTVAEGGSSSGTSKRRRLTVSVTVWVMAAGVIVSPLRALVAWADNVHACRSVLPLVPLTN